MDQTVQIELPQAETRNQPSTQIIDQEAHAVLESSVVPEGTYDTIDLMMFDCIMANTLSS